MNIGPFSYICPFISCQICLTYITTKFHHGSEQKILPKTLETKFEILIYKRYRNSKGHNLVYKIHDEEKQSRENNNKINNLTPKTKTMTITDYTKYFGWTQKLAKGKQFMSLIKHRPCSLHNCEDMLYTNIRTPITNKTPDLL